MSQYATCSVNICDVASFENNASNSQLNVFSLFEPRRVNIKPLICIIFIILFLTVTFYVKLNNCILTQETPLSLFFILTPVPRILYFLQFDPEDDILNVETCRSMLFIIIVSDIIVQSICRIFQYRNFQRFTMYIGCLCETEIRSRVQKFPA